MFVGDSVVATATGKAVKAGRAITVLVAAILFGSGLSLEWPTISVEAAPWSVAEIICQTRDSIRTDRGRLSIDAPVPSETISSQEIHSYRIALTAGQFARIIVDQLGAEVTVTLSDPGEKVITTVASLSGTLGPVSVSTVADSSGDYRVELRIDRSAPPGRYRIKVDALRVSTATDRDRIAAEQASEQGYRFYSEDTASSYRKAAAEFERSLPIWRGIGDSYGEGLALVMIGRAYRRLGQPEKSISNSKLAVVAFVKSGSQLMQGYAYNNIAVACGDMGELEKALAYYEKARPLFSATGDRQGEALAVNNISQVSALLGDSREALKNFEQVLPIFRALGDRRREGLALNNIGRVYDGLGEPAKALLHYSRALSLADAIADRRLRAQTLTNIGVIHSNLGEYDKALEYYNKAVPDLKEIGDSRTLAGTLDNIGFVYVSQGKIKEALGVYAEALQLYERAGDRIGQALTLQDIAKGYEDSGQLDEALSTYNRALGLSRDARDRRREATIMTRIGRFYLNRGDSDKALDSYNQALPISNQIGDKYIEAATLYGIAGAERSRGRLKEARIQIEASLGLVEKVRAGAVTQALRASYLASKEDSYKFYVDLLMQMDTAYPGEGLDGLALQATERARARSLLDTISQSGTDIRQGADPALLERLHALQRQLNQKAFQQNLQANEDQKRALAGQIEALTTDYERTQAELRATSPHLAELVEPRPLGLAEIQQKVLDPDTLLLEYSLGKDRSFLWAVTSSSINSFVLPPGPEIEQAARHSYELLTERGKQIKFETPEERRQRIAAADQEYHAQAAWLSRTLLGPVGDKLANKRLVIVGEGALEYIPFSALPDPAIAATGSAGPAPLVAHHEILSLPSASVLGVLRQEVAGRKPAPMAVAVLADPVFDNSDPRAKPSAAQETALARGHGKRGATVSGPPADAGASKPDARDAGNPQESNEERPVRLPFTRAEAEAIVSLAPKGNALVALDFDASIKTATSPSMSRYRILHFATHGVLDSQHPELSGIVLSLVNQKGEVTDGFLRLNEIYNLKLPAELVVLSGCKTGLGKEIKGEGLVGLTRGFMYAGAPRVVVSLWDVNDAATAELMKLFYQAMLKQNARPAEALRAAQLLMMKRQGSASPYYWAAFVLQGEWR
jgi:CHAT domain-containing protein/Tfp pilus assembly protein PilF